MTRPKRPSLNDTTGQIYMTKSPTLSAHATFVSYGQSRTLLSPLVLPGALESYKDLILTPFTCLMASMVINIFYKPLTLPCLGLTCIQLQRHLLKTGPSSCMRKFTLKLAVYFYAWLRVGKNLEEPLKSFSSNTKSSLLPPLPITQKETATLSVHIRPLPIQ